MKGQYRKLSPTLKPLVTTSVLAPYSIERPSYRENSKTYGSKWEGPRSGVTKVLRCRDTGVPTGSPAVPRIVISKLWAHVGVTALGANWA